MPQNNQYKAISFSRKNLLTRSLLNTGILIYLLSISALLHAQETGTASRIEQKLFTPATYMWYTKPATQWEDALPVGNGRLGAMVYGKTGEEIIQFNEDTPLETPVVKFICS